MQTFRWVVWSCSLYVLRCAGAPPASRNLNPRTSLQLASAPDPHSEPANLLWTRAQAVLEKRCVVCQGCHDAPCPLELETYEAVERGAPTAQVYDSSRLTAADPTRLFVDAQTLAEWPRRAFTASCPSWARRTPNVACC
jgi:hypothetical protein